MDYDHLDDRELVDGILSNNIPLIEYFFQKKCSGLITYILMSVFDGNIDKHELVSEFFLFMSHNDWQVFRRFQYRSRLMTYLTVVATRFFQKKREDLMEKSSPVTLNEKAWQDHNAGISLDKRIDIHTALQRMPNARYRKVIEVLDLQDVRPELLAEEMNVTVDNLYNIHRRALVQLRLVMGRKEDWV